MIDVTNKLAFIETNAPDLDIYTYIYEYKMFFRLAFSAVYLPKPTLLKSLSLTIWAIRPWISSIVERLQSRVALDSLSSDLFSLTSVPVER